ncbi:unnamed protein product [Calicophoron daubneyi]|uniref:EDRF1 N-terminal domain-containing protein n=1 Tax=Calicophoron daubneyi TaxID=300641 RepID=A0AAV2T1X0_CALDB
MENSSDDDSEIIAGDTQSVEKSILLLKDGQLNDIATLHEGFNISRMPTNYMTKRSYIEKIIFHATMSDAMKSPFSGFTIANRFIANLASIDVISGIRSLKSIAKIPLGNTNRTSIMVHRIGNTWLLDEFDVDSFLLGGEHSSGWIWLRKFLSKKNVLLCSEALSRNALILRDLYIRFLYHTVGQSAHLGLRTIGSLTFGFEGERKSLPAPSSGELGESHVSDVSHSSDLTFPSDIEPPLPGGRLNSSVGIRSPGQGSPKRPWTVNPDEYLHMAKWQLQDLSFLVGSDLAIFGTPKHPCISLKLSPMHESINVLTGVDMWLENILNEVPEVAMCYHNEGIVMQEYEIYKTSDIPSIADFKEKHVYRTLQNLVMFLKRNATQEGHTYWLVKEPGLDVVKLYDLTSLCHNESVQSGKDSSKDESGSNPFILPVATLSYRLAERRWSEFMAFRKRRLAGSTRDDGLFETEVDVFTDALRLLRSCLNLISLLEDYPYTPNVNSSLSSSNSVSAGLTDLKMRAVLLLCRIYLVTPQDLLNTCIQRLQSAVKHSSGVATMNVDDLLEEHPKKTDTNFSPVQGEDDSVMLQQIADGSNDSTRWFGKGNKCLLGSLLMDAFRSSNSAELSQLASAVVQRCTATIPPTPFAWNTSDSGLSLDGPSNAVLATNGGALDAHAVGSPSDLFSMALLKTYIRKAIASWTRCQHQVSNKAGFSLTTLPLLREVLRHSIPPIILLEHLIPDSHSTTLPSPSKLAAESSVCPLCKSKGLFNDQATSLDCCLLRNMLRSASFLLPVSIIWYIDAIRQLKASVSESQLEQLSLDFASSDSFIMSTSCAPSLSYCKSMFEAAAYGPSHHIEKETSVNASVNSVHWLDLLRLACRCLRRVIVQNPSPFSEEDESKRKPANRSRGERRRKSNESAKSSSIRDDSQSSTDSEFFIPQMNTCTHWWSVLVNVYVIALRNEWADGSYSKQSHSEDLDSNLDFGLRMILHPPCGIQELNDRSQFVTCMNEFQLYKVAAAVSQLHPSCSWISHLRSLPSKPTPILPTQTLIYEPVSEKSKSGKDSRNSARFQLTAVCLARALDSLLRQFSRSDGQSPVGEEVRSQLCASLLITANEYIPVCLGDETESEKKDSAYISTLHNVLKQVMRRLPEELTETNNHVAQPRRGSSLILSKNTILQMLDLRLNQMNIAIHMHQNCSVVSGGPSQAPNWSTIVGHARTALIWHFNHMNLPSSSSQPIDSLTVKDMAVFLKLVNRLVTLETVNLDVLSIAGIMTILKDIALTHSVIKILNERLLIDSSLENLKVDFELPVRSLYYNLICLCASLVEKYRSRLVLSKTDRKSGGRKKGNGSTSSLQHEVPPNVELASSMLDFPEFSRENGLKTYQKFTDVLATHGLDSFDQLCQSLVLKMERLSSSLSH